MKAWHVLIVVAVAVAAFFGYRRFAKASVGSVSGPQVLGPVSTTIPQTPVRQSLPPKAVAVVRKPVSRASTLAGSVGAAASTAIRNSGIPGASILAKPGGAVAQKSVAVGKKVAGKTVKFVKKLF